MSGDPVGDDELHREQKQQQEDGGGVEKEKILSPLPEDDEHEQPNGESDVLLLTKEKSFVFEERIKDANLLKMRGNERLRNNELVEAEKNYRRGLFHVDMDPMQVKPFHYTIMLHYYYLEPYLMVVDCCYVHHRAGDF